MYGEAVLRALSAVFGVDCLVSAAEERLEVNAAHRPDILANLLERGGERRGVIALLYVPAHTPIPRHTSMYRSYGVIAHLYVPAHTPIPRHISMYRYIEEA